MQLHQFLFRPSHKMLVILSNCKEKRLPFPLLERATSCAYDFSPAPAPRTLHPGTSFARWTSSTVLCPLAAVHFALRSRQTLCPFEKQPSSIGPISVGLALPKRKAGPFFAERCRHPGGGFCAVLRGFGAYFSSPWRILSKLRFGFSAPPVFPCANRLCFLGSVPSLGFGGARFARFRFSILDVPFGLFHCSHPAALLPDGVCVHDALSQSKLPPSWGSMQISDLWILRFETHSHFRILAGFGIALCRLSGLGAIRWLPVDGESVRTRFPPGPIVSWRLCALVLCFCLCPPKFCASRFGKSRSMEKSSRRVFCLVSRSSAASLPALRQRRRSFRYACVVHCGFLPAFWTFASSASFGPLPLALFAPSRPRRKSSDFRVSLLIGRAASLALLLGLPPAVFSPSDDFFELPLSRSLYATPLLHPYQTHAIKAFARSISGSRRHATAGDLGLFSIRHWKRPLSFFLSIL